MLDMVRHANRQQAESRMVRKTNFKYGANRGHGKFTEWGTARSEDRLQRRAMREQAENLVVVDFGGRRK